ncbi:MAG: ATP-binding protein [Pseudomonadales bacterium]
MATLRQSTPAGGKLRIGDDWNAIRIIALSQSNPLKAIAEFVENSIDAGASRIVIVRGKERGQAYVSVTDNGEGIRRDADGIPDFHYVATHICDSMKRHLDKDDKAGIQGEFGIGLLSFWTVGEALTLTCSSAAGDTYQMTMKKGDTDYTIRKSRALFESTGTELKIKPLLPGMRGLSGQKLQWYLAAELRDRIRKAGVDVIIRDRMSRKEFKVEPRAYDGQLIHTLPEARTPTGDIYLELYLDDPSPERKVGLYRNGTRVLEDISILEHLKHSVWGSGYLEGVVDVPFLNLTPGTRLGVLHDDQYMRAFFALRPVEDRLEDMLRELRKAEEEKASRKVLNSIRRAFREALLALPVEEYDWFDVQTNVSSRKRQAGGERESRSIDDDNNVAVEGDSGTHTVSVSEIIEETATGQGQKDFFDYPGPLYSVRISPASSVLRVGGTRNLRALARDRAGRSIDSDVSYRWQVVEGRVSIDAETDEIVTVTAPAQPQLVRLQVTATQGEMSCEAEALVTVTDSLVDETGQSASQGAGLPGYTFQKAAGELWRSRYDEAQNVIVINNGHRDFVYASRTRSLQLRYISRLFAKELVYHNFPGLSPEALLERLIELSLYTEENLK